MLVNVFWYSWLGMLLLAASFVFPPLAILFVVLPVMHYRRRRRLRSPEWAEARAHARKIAWLESL